jgi:hypothetical protein
VGLQDVTEGGTNCGLDLREVGKRLLVAEVEELTGWLCEGDEAEAVGLEQCGTGV